MSIFRGKSVALASVLGLWGCYERPSTLGLDCDTDEQCDGFQKCSEGVCVAGENTAAAECSPGQPVDCGPDDCGCPMSAPYCCGDGRCYDTPSGCADSYGLTCSDENCVVCQVVAEERVDYCFADAPYCCFGPTQAQLFCNEAPTDACP